LPKIFISGSSLMDVVKSRASFPELGSE